MATLTGKQLKDSYQSLVTIKDADDANPTSGQLENGLGNPITALGIGIDSVALLTSNTSTLHIHNTVTDKPSAIYLTTDGTGATANDGFSIYVDGATENVVLNNRSNTRMEFRTNSDEKLRIASNGDIAFYDDANNQGLFWDADVARLGIGTTSPGHPLTVTANPGSADTPVAWIHNSGNATSYDGTVISTVNDGSDVEVLHVRTNNTTYANGTSLMLVRGDGNVGIGTTSPAGKLAVDAGNTSGTTIDGLHLVKNLTAQSNYVAFQQGTIGYRVGIKYDDDNFPLCFFYGNSTPTASSPGSEAMRIKNSGDISFRDSSTNEAFYWDASAGSLGIGTVPATPLHVNATNANACIINVTGTSPNYIFDIRDDNVSQFRVDSSGNVGTNYSNGAIHTYGSGAFGGKSVIKASSENALALLNSTTGGSAKVALNFTNEFVASQYNYLGRIVAEPTQAWTSTASTRDSDLAFFTTLNGVTSERMRILSSGGITFNGDTASANALDDYEEGTWTPAFVPTTGSFTTMTMDITSATYTKIGRQVTVRAFIGTDNVNATGASGELQISGLPFTSGASEHTAVSIGYARSWSSAPDSGYAINTVINLQKTNATANSSVSDLTTGATNNQNQIILTATYFV